MSFIPYRKMIFQPQTFQPWYEKSGVKKFMVENSGVDMSYNPFMVEKFEVET